MTNVAKAVRLAREKYPERYCSKCLWRLSSGPCPKHPIKPRPDDVCSECGMTYDDAHFMGKACYPLKDWQGPSDVTGFNRVPPPATTHTWKPAPPKPSPLPVTATDTDDDILPF